MIAASAHAKINLRLAVLAREANGYHQIETIFCRIALADTLEFERVSEAGIALDVAGADVGPLEDNLVMRAARAFVQAAAVEPRIRIRLRKVIPAGAGLGGGSSDAAAALVALNRMHGEPLAHDAIVALGAHLGSDVPFFLADTALALAGGRGERILTLPALDPAPALIALPERAVSTADAYRRLSETLNGSRTAPSLLSTEDLSSWRALARCAANDFERVILPDIPALVPALAMLRAHGAIIARMSGSGSAIFGIFESVDARDLAHAALAAADPAFRLYVTDACV